MTLEIKTASAWQQIGADVTNHDGRCPKLLPVDHSLQSGVYRCTFDTAAYYGANMHAPASRFKADSTRPHPPVPAHKRLHSRPPAHTHGV